MESSNDVIIQNLVVPSNLISTQQHQSDGINISLQNPEVEVPVSATKTSSGMIVETRTNNEIVHTVANNIPSCQIPTTPSHDAQAFEESVTKLEQVNGKVYNKYIDAFQLKHFETYNRFTLEEAQSKPILFLGFR